MAAKRPYQCHCKKHTICPCDGQNCPLCKNDPRHGTPNGYGNLRCRCDACRDAHAKFCWQRRQIRINRVLPPPEHVHGTPNGYGNWGCRCRPCKDAWAETSLERAHRARDGLTDCVKGLAPYPKPRKG